MQHMEIKVLHVAIVLSLICGPIGILFSVSVEARLGSSVLFQGIMVLE